MFTSTKIIKKIKEAPENPGVYFFLDDQKNYLYIGKAKNIRARLSSYLTDKVDDWKITSLHKDAADVIFQTTQSELEALILEAQKIQALHPQLNILLKNSQPFIYFFFSEENTPIKRFELTFDLNQKGKHYGPFLNRKLAKQLFELLNKVFETKICNKKIKNGCLFFHLGQCAGFCTESFDVEKYNKNIAFIQKFFEVGPKKFLNIVSKKITELIKQEQFEEAKIWTKNLEVLNTASLNLNSSSTLAELLATQQIGQHIWLYSKEHNFLMLVQNVNNHVAQKDFIWLEKNESDAKLSELLCSYYQTNQSPLIIFTNFEIEAKSLLQEFIAKWQNIAIAPEIINLYSLSNRATFIDLALALFGRQTEALIKLPLSLKKTFGCKNLVTKIDCFDISHHQELFIVGSCVRFENNFANPKLFRHFKIKSTKIPNDYQSLREIVYRRYINDYELPDLILIDGGKGQLKAVNSLFQNLDFISLAKKHEIVFYKKIVDGQITYAELKLNLTSIEGLFLTKVRDTAHNFAINFHRSLKNKILK